MFHTTSFSRSGHLPDASHYRYSCSTSFFQSTGSSEGGDDILDRLLEDMASVDLGREFQQHQRQHYQHAFPLPYSTLLSSSGIPRTSTGPHVDILDDDYDEDGNENDQFPYSDSHGGHPYPAPRQIEYRVEENGRSTAQQQQQQRQSASSSASASSYMSASSTFKRPQTERRAITYPLPLHYPHPSTTPGIAPSTASTTRHQKSKSNYYPLPPLPYQLAGSSKSGYQHHSKAASKISSSSTGSGGRRRMQNGNQQTDQWAMVRAPQISKREAAGDTDLAPSDSISQISVSVHSKDTPSSGKGGSTLYSYIPCEERRGRTRRRGERWESILSVGQEQEAYPGEGRSLADAGAGEGSSQSQSTAAIQMRMQTGAPRGKFETRVVTPYD